MIKDEEATNDSKSSMVIRNGLNDDLDEWKDITNTWKVSSHFRTCHPKNLSHDSRHPWGSWIPDPQMTSRTWWLVSCLCATGRIVFRSAKAIELASVSNINVFQSRRGGLIQTKDMRELDTNIGDLDGLIKDTDFQTWFIFMNLFFCQWIQAATLVVAAVAWFWFPCNAASHNSPWCALVK
jgi:hypothetical protein